MTGGSIPCAFSVACVSAWSGATVFAAEPTIQLLVHHRATDSEERTLITLCIRCPIR
jgi:hypothetical protein